ncbi:MAG: hypothetical protein KF777_11850 [Planctomycetaceae bacterium]|nr:hypothetical protein [Planctomycetaceae bacterium]
MRISQFSVLHVRIPLRKTITHASHSRDETDSLVVRCELDSGTVGWGEGLPREYVTGETIDDSWELLTGTDWAAGLGGSEANLAGWLGRLERFRLPGLKPDPRDCYGNSVRTAIELSVLDAVCREAGVPLSHVTSNFPAASAIREHAPRVRYSAAFTAMSRWKQIERALKLRYYGFAAAKVKLGVAGVNDRTLLRRLRWMLGSRFDLRGDANEAWTCENLQRHVERLVPYRLSSLEQPVPHAEVGGLAALRGKLGVPLMLDESLCSELDARRAIEEGTCDLFNLRLSKCGGFLPCLKLAALAHQAGLGYQLGCQVGETGILSAAGRHFATSVANIRFLEGSYDRFLVREPLTREDLTFGRGGYADELTGPGLGITIDEAAVGRVTIRQHVVVPRS